jgi:hypothetical protein
MNKGKNNKVTITVQMNPELKAFINNENDKTKIPLWFMIEQGLKLLYPEFKENNVSKPR